MNARECLLMSLTAISDEERDDAPLGEAVRDPLAEESYGLSDFVLSPGVKWAGGSTCVPHWPTRE